VVGVYRASATKPQQELKRDERREKRAKDKRRRTKATTQRPQPHFNEARIARKVLFYEQATQPHQVALWGQEEAAEGSCTTSTKTLSRVTKNPSNTYKIVVKKGRTHGSPSQKITTLTSREILWQIHLPQLENLGCDIGNCGIKGCIPIKRPAKILALQTRFEVSRSDTGVFASVFK
jgi:hypothetical protein